MKNKYDVLFSHKCDDWATPKVLYQFFLDRDFIDPCPLFSNEDNLQKIFVNKNIFINPPYSQIDKWVSFIKSNIEHNFIALLIPSRTDTKYFHDLLKLNPFIYFFKGRLHFNESNSAPFPSLLLVFNNSKLNLYGYGSLIDFLDCGLF